jgi:hypothetical protein
MKEYYGNYLGICIDNQDPEHRGRCQIFIPHIMPLLYENWNQEGKDITLECVGNNIPSGLNSDIIDKLKKILPWAEAALPVIGNSTSGSYNSITGNFNQTSSPESLIFNQGAAAVDATGKSGADFIFNSEKQTDANGNLKVYYMPGNDGGGKYEIAGINVRYHPQKAAQLKSLIDQGQYQQAEAEAKAYIMQYTNTVAPISNGNAGIEYALRDAAFNRGQGGCNWMAKFAAGVTPLSLGSATAEQRKAILEAQNRDPIGFLNKFRAASETYERDRVGYRANFWKGLTKRWNDRLSNSLALAASGGSAPVNNPASNPDAAALPPTPHPFNNSDATSQSWNDPGLASVTQVSLDQPISLTGGTSPAVASAASAATALPATPAPTTGTSGGGSGTFSWRSAVARSGLSVDSRGIARLPSGTTGCMRVSWNIAGYITGRSNMAGSSGVAQAKLWQTLNSRLASQAPGFWGYLGKFSGGYQPQQGDLVSHPYQPHGHAQIYVDGRWHAHKEADGDFSNYAGKSGGSHVWRLTPAGQEAVRRTNVCNTQFLGQPYAGPLGPVGGTFDSENGLENGTNLVQNPTGTMTAPMDTTGMPQGLFAHPAPGALLWVFFREGNPMYPVYFAASYGASEWQAMQQASSPPLYDAQNGGSEINSESHFRPNNAGTLMFRGSVTAGKDNRAVRLAHASGAYFELLPTGSVHFSPNEHVSHIAGNGYSYCLNREEWTQGDENRVTIGNQRIVVGNPSQANIETIDKLTEKVKSINQKMAEPSQGSSQAPA